MRSPKPHSVSALQDKGDCRHQTEIRSFISAEIARNDTAEESKIFTLAFELIANIFTIEKLKKGGKFPSTPQNLKAIKGAAFDVS